MFTEFETGIFLATGSDRCEPDIHFIRGGDETLWHICIRKDGENSSEEYYHCAKVKFDYTQGWYYCEKKNCATNLDLEDVWADGKGTGCEGNC
jgi:hypothetical protein